MTDTERLNRWYRLLTYAYPRWYRRERGAELVTTLLDDATPGQRRPAVRDVLDLFRCALRARVRPPRGILGLAVTLFVAAYLGVVGAALGVLGSGYPSPPPEAQAMAVAAVTLPVPVHNTPGPAVHCELMDCPGWDGKDDVVAYAETPDRTDQTAVYFRVPSDQMPTTVTQAHNRLAAAGWQVGAVRSEPPDGFSFDATRDGLRVSFSSAPSGTNLSVTKGWSHGAARDLVVGGAVGVAIGWLIAVWAVQRHRRQALVRRISTVLAAVPFLVLGPLVMWEVAVLSLGFLGDQPAPRVVKTPLLILPGGWTVDSVLSVLIGLSALAALALSVAPGRRRPLPVPQAPAPA